jgi:hypothetical protein
MKKFAMVVLLVLSVIAAGCVETLRTPRPTLDPSYTPQMNIMDMVKEFAKQTAIARTQEAEGVYSTPIPPTTTPRPQFEFVVITQSGDVFGFDANTISLLPQQTINVDGMEYQGISLYDILTNVDSIKFSVNTIELQGDTTFAYGFEQISNQALASTLLVQNSSGGFDVVSSNIPKENWVTNIKVIRVK